MTKFNSLLVIKFIRMDFDENNAASSSALIILGQIAMSTDLGAS